MSYFTCEVHKLHYSSIQGLKEHVTKFHLDEKPNDIRSVPAKKKAAVSSNKQQNGKSCTDLCTNPETIKISITSSECSKPSTNIGHTRPENVKTLINTSCNEEQQLQCHICGDVSLCSAQLDSHLQTHFKDNLLPSSSKIAGVKILIKTETDSAEVPQIKDYTSNSASIDNRIEHNASSESGESSEDDNEKNDPDFCPSDDGIVGTRDEEIPSDGERSNVLPKKFAGKVRKNVCTHPGCNWTKPFKDLCHLKEHLRIHTGENKPFICSWKGCDHKFKRCNELTLHYRIHTGEKPTNNVNCSCCKCCTRNEKHMTGYKPHLPIGKLVCYFCGYVPINLHQDFDRHMSTHTLERPFRCKICNKLCHNDEGVKKHAKVHTAKDISERCHKCKDCGSRFKDGTSLRLHRNTHSTFRPYSCSSCLKSYKRYTDLGRHISTVHIRLRSYKCNICTKREFARRDFFKFHMNTIHPGIEFEEPEPQFKESNLLRDYYVITCNLCKINFKDNIKFSQHKRKCSGTVEPKKVKARKIKQKLETIKAS